MNAIARSNDYFVASQQRRWMFRIANAIWRSPGSSRYVFLFEKRFDETFENGYITPYVYRERFQITQCIAMQLEISRKDCKTYRWCYAICIYMFDDIQGHELLEFELIRVYHDNKDNIWKQSLFTCFAWCSHLNAIERLFCCVPAEKIEV